jgi:hypothetical protein
MLILSDLKYFLSMKIFFLAVVGTVWTQSIPACDLCAIYAASQARGEVGRGVFAGVAEQFTHFGTVQVDGKEVSNPSGQYLDSSISQIFGGYNFNDRIGLQFNLPVIYRSYQRPDSLGGIERGTESGLADASLLATFVPYSIRKKHFTFNWSILAGVKFPTGSTDRIKEELTEVEAPIGPPSGIHGHDLTLGTGSYDAIFGTGIYSRWNHVFLSANVQYAVRGPGDFDYQFANDLTWGGGPGYFLALDEQYTLSLQAVVSGEYKGKDTFRGASAVDTGMTAVYLGPQINFTWGEKLAAYLVVDLPMSLDNTSLQTVPDYRARAGVTWRF